jgi:hypothetical protein
MGVVLIVLQTIVGGLVLALPVDGARSGERIGHGKGRSHLTYRVGVQTIKVDLEMQPIENGLKGTKTEVYTWWVSKAMTWWRIHK